MAAARRFLSALLGVFLASGFLLVSVADRADAYPDRTCTVTVSAQAVRSGGTVLVNAYVVPALDPVTAAGAVWSVSFAGVTAHHTGGTFRHRFDVPKDSVTSVRTVRAVLMTGTSVECQTDVDVVVDPDDPGTPPKLPDTGAPSELLVVLGGLFLVAGAVMVSNGRRDRPDGPVGQLRRSGRPS